MILADLCERSYYFMKPLPGLVLNSGAATFEPVSDSQRPMLGLDQMGETSLAFLKNTDLSARLAGRRPRLALGPASSTLC